MSIFKMRKSVGVFGCVARVKIDGNYTMAEHIIHSDEDVN